MTRMRKDQDVSLAVLGRICDCLECDFGDVVEYIHDNESSKDNKYVRILVRMERMSSCMA